MVAWPADGCGAGPGAEADFTTVPVRSARRLFVSVKFAASLPIASDMSFTFGSRFLWLGAAGFGGRGTLLAALAEAVGVGSESFFFTTTSGVGGSENNGSCSGVPGRGLIGSFPLLCGTVSVQRNAGMALQAYEFRRRYAVLFGLYALKVTGYQT